MFFQAKQALVLKAMQQTVFKALENVLKFGRLLSDFLLTKSKSNELKLQRKNSENMTSHYTLYFLVYFKIDEPLNTNFLDFCPFQTSPRKKFVKQILFNRSVLKQRFCNKSPQDFILAEFEAKSLFDYFHVQLIITRSCS